MALEIERKFLVKNSDYKTVSHRNEFISQGYLNTDADRTVRVRVRGEQGFITIKSRNHGAVRGEWEYAIPVEDAMELLALCPHTLSKKRWYVHHDGHVWEIDEFTGRHTGLTLAEVELCDAEENISIPDFIDCEVTGDQRYYNSTLSKL